MSGNAWKMYRLIVVLVLMFTLSAFVARDAGAQSQNVLKLGYMGALMMRECLEIQKWHNLFAKMINEQGGLSVGDKKYKIEFSTYDVGFEDPARTLTAVQKAIFQDKVNIFVDNFGAASSITNIHTDPKKVLTFGGGITNDMVSPKYQYFFRHTGGFFIGSTSYIIARDFLKLGAKTSIVCTIDNEQGRFTAKNYGEAHQLAGLKELPPIFFAQDTVDYGPVATKIKNLGVDMVDFGINTGVQIVNLCMALRDVGWKGYLAPGTNLPTDVINSIVSKVGSFFDGAETIYLDPRGIPEVMANPQMKALMDRYTKEYGEFVPDGCFWTGGWFILMDAIKATQSVDTTVLKDYLGNGPKATKTFGGYTQLYARPDLNQYRTVDAAPGSGRGVIKNGKLTYLDMLTVKDGYLVSIKLHNLVDVYQQYWDKYGKPTFPPEKAVFDFADLRK
jgi:hypothetical protein